MLLRISKEASMHAEPCKKYSHRLSFFTFCNAPIRNLDVFFLEQWLYPSVFLETEMFDRSFAK